jgi:hypothetical protein
MGKSDSQLGQYDVTARLFQRISNLPQNQQFIYLKQFIKSNITTYLFQMIIDMSDDQKIKLLEQLGEMPFEEEPITTIDLDDASLMRKHPRKTCSIRANCVVGDYSFECYIVDMSTFGLFVKTDEAFPINEKIQVSFSLPKTASPFKLSGEIAWSNLEGIGIKFRVLPVPQKKMIQTFIST